MTRLPILLLVAASLSACSQDVRTACGHDGEPCCGNGQCESGLACGPDGRCRSCGAQGMLCCAGEACDSGLRCGEGLCRCAAESDAAFCARLGKDCGALTGTDDCGEPRTASCGACVSPKTCGGAGVPNVCGCRETDRQFCSRLGASCGTFSGLDACGAERTTDCGTCSSPLVCGGAGQANVCACPETDAELCARLEKNCDELTTTDSCGIERVARCGACVEPLVCGIQGAENVCGCSETDAAFCERRGAECGLLTGTDTCGLTRKAQCGVCEDFLACGGSGTSNRCEVGWVERPGQLPGDLRSNWGTSPNDMWAGSSAGAIVRWDGSSWAVAHSIPGVTIRSIRGLAADDVWAVGFAAADRAGVVLHWNGAAWSAMTPPFAALGLNAVWAHSPNEVWVVGGHETGLTLRWDGSTWHQVPLPEGTLELHDVWGFGPNDVWAVGFLGTIRHWDGESWAAYPMPATTILLDHLSGIWGSRSDDVWAVGTMGLIVHWDGVRWSWPQPPAFPSLTAVWGASADDVWAVGDAGTIVRRLSSGSWQQQPSPTTKLLMGVWGSSSTDVWAVGADGLILRRLE